MTLIFALIALAVLSLTSLALVRAVGSDAQILGNIAFKQDATAAADRAVSQAVAWIQANNSALANDNESSGYYASNRDSAPTEPVDVTGSQFPAVAGRQLIDWDGSSCAGVSSKSGKCVLKAATASVVNGNAASYVIFRLCTKPGDYTTDSTITCARPITAANAGSISKGAVDYESSTRFSNVEGPYYRIVVRVVGARSTTSFVEAIVHF